jgi:hypothetical protein
VVLLTRHPYQVLASTIHFTMINWAAEEMFEGKKKLWKILEVYDETMAAIIRCKNNPKNKERVLFLKFEDLLKNPHTKLKEVFNWYEVDDSDGIVAEVLAKAEDNKASLRGTCLAQSRFFCPKDKFITMLGGSDKGRIKQHVAPYMQMLGYE